MPPTASSLLDVLLFLLGGLLLGALVRWWRPEVSRRAVLGYLLLAFAFYAVPLATPASQAATDLAYVHIPWKETLAEKVAPRNPVLSDVPLQVLPFHALVRARLLAGEAPLWSHEMGTGQPLLGNAQSAPFAPLHLMALPRPPLQALTLAVAWQTLVALLLMHALLRRVGAGGAGAAFGSVAFALSTYAVAWAYHPLGAVAAWLPGVLLGLVLLRHGERGGFSGLVACATAATLAGHPESLANTALASAAVTAVLLVRREPGRLRFLARLPAAAVLTFALSAPALLPFVETLSESERWEAVHRNPRIVQPPPPSPATLLPVLQPLVHGSPREGTWRGPINFNELCTVWAGLAALAFALAGALVLRGRVLAVLLGGGAALAAALRVPPFFEVMHALPVLGHGAHGRLRLLWVLAVAAAAGLSLEPLARRRAGVLAAALALALCGGAVAALPPPGDAPWTRAWWIVALAGAALCAAALLLPRLRAALPKIALAALAADLLLLGLRYHPALDPRFDLAPPPVVAWLAERAREGPPHRVLAPEREMMPNLAALHGIWDARAHDPMAPAGPSAMIGGRLRPRHKVGRLVLFPATRRDLALENYLGARYFLTRHRKRLPPPWRPVFNHQGGRIWENPGALPLFFLPARIESAGSREEALARGRANPDFAESAAVEGAAARAPQRGAVRIVSAPANGFELEVAGGGGVVVSSVSHARGWRATLDGRRLPLLRAHGAFLAFAAPPGRHRVVLDYRPAGWPIGWVLCGAGALAAAWAAWRRRPG